MSRRDARLRETEYVRSVGRTTSTIVLRRCFSAFISGLLACCYIAALERSSANQHAFLIWSVETAPPGFHHVARPDSPLVRPHGTREPDALSKAWSLGILTVGPNAPPQSIQCLALRNENVFGTDQFCGTERSSRGPPA